MKITILELDKSDSLKEIVGTEEKVDVKTYSTGGRGKKQCRNAECGVYVGVRNRVCPLCNTEFTKDKAPIPIAPIGLNPPSAEIASVSFEDTPQITEPKLVIKTNKPYGLIIHTPSGKCPIVPTLQDLESAEGIIKWAEEVRAWGLDVKKEYYTVSAIIYFARYTYESLSKELNLITSTLNSWES